MKSLKNCFSLFHPFSRTKKQKKYQRKPKNIRRKRTRRGG